MSKKNDILQELTLTIEEIEDELEEIINKKKEEIEKDLEKRIQQEKEKAKKKIDQIQEELEIKKDEIINYRTAFAEFENNKTDIKSHKKLHIEKAIQYLRKIETLTAQSLEELKKISELDQKLDEITQIVREKAEIFKKDLEEKIEAAPGETERQGNEEIELEKEREKLKKILELIGKTETPKR
ncbi:MAG: hypothetical protein OEY25_06830 [Candidatus Aminicenantes bacterium]|nr:hypothetical protein [Candidatus Aminicenantes bacterium]MDH5706422.1 hypothetical protein [Candidatus Aminicenantes bacterium]